MEDSKTFGIPEAKGLNVQYVHVYKCHSTGLYMYIRPVIALDFF